MFFISYIHLLYSKNIAYKYILYLLVAKRERSTICKVSSLPQYYRAGLFFAACDDFVRTCTFDSVVIENDRRCISLKIIATI